jgi:hypothetical protein
MDSIKLPYKKPSLSQNKTNNPMHIAYSALRVQPQKTGNQHGNETGNLALRYQAYLATCQKFHKEIIAIQKQMPGWRPKFNY